MTAATLPADIQALRDRALEFVRAELHPIEQRIAERGSIDPGEIEEIRRRGDALGFPDEYRLPPGLGGRELPMLAQVVLEEVAGHATNGLGFLIPRGRGPRVLYEIATPGQRERYVAPALDGNGRGAWAITEPNAAGSDVNAIESTAVRDEDGAWRLNGEKWFVTGGDTATFFIVLAWAGEEQELFFVDREAPGLEIVRRPRFMHDPYVSGHVELRLADCRVPEENRIPAGNAGSKRWFAVERLMIAARCCGAAERLIDEATAWAKERVAFGQPIADYQAVQFMLADSLTELLAARLMTYHAAEAVDTHPDPRIVHGKIAMAKLYASEMANRVADRALQIFGGRGYMEENLANRYFRELRVDRIWEGTSEIQRVIIARGLLKRGQAPYSAVLPGLMAVAQLTRDLSPLFEPRSLAVVGVSTDPEKWGHGSGQRALLGEHRRSVYLVNRRGGEVLGRRAYRSVTELPEPPDLVLVAVQAAAFEEAVDDALAGGARAIVVLAAGLGEMGPDGAARERAVAQRVRAAGAVMMGPNCLGIFDARAELEINGLTHGSIGVISQSGNFALELDELAADHGLGFSRFASLGNQADLDVVETLADFARHEPTRLIAVYCEDFRDGRAFARAAAEATTAGKPVLLLDAGRSEAGAAAARSHTGALLSGPRAVDAACAAAGILRVATPRELIDLAAALLAGIRVPGRRLGILTDGGGSGVVACDLAVAAGLEVPPLGDALSARLKEALAPESPTRNPVDLAASGPKDYFTYERAARLLLDSDEVDSVLLTGYFGGYSRRGGDAERRETDVGHAVGRIADRRLVAQTMYATSSPAAALREEGVPVYRDIEAAARVLGRLAARREPRGVPGLPPPAQPPARAGYFEARELLGEVAFAPARAVSDVDEARTAAHELGYPVVLKALGAVHKSDAGGIVLGIEHEAELVRRFTDLAGRLAPAAWSVERMAPLEEGLELVVGVRRDPRFGPVALVGLGGLYAELLDDVAVALAPVGEDEAEELVRSLRGAALLTGLRGRPPLDAGAAARALAAVSRVGVAHPEIAELEINPLLVTAGGATGLDARIVLA